MADGVDHLHITSGSDVPEGSAEGACAMAQDQPGDVSHDTSRDLELQERLVVPEPKQMKNIQVSCHDFRFLQREILLK